MTENVLKIVKNTKTAGWCVNGCGKTVSQHGWFRAPYKCSECDYFAPDRITFILDQKRAGLK